jgi:hypothetical protein
VAITANGYDVTYIHLEGDFFVDKDIDECNICEKQNKWSILSTCSTSIIIHTDISFSHFFGLVRRREKNDLSFLLIGLN